MPKLNYPLICGIDWLSLHCELHNSPASWTDGFFKIKVENYPTPQYFSRCIFEYSFEGNKYQFAELLFNPRISVIKQSSCHLRLLNQSLYYNNWYSLLQRLIQDFNIEYKSITRLDIYADFQRFYGGRRPLNFIRDFMQQKVLKIGISKGYCAFDSLGYTIANGTKNIRSDFSVGSPLFSGITWGSKGYLQTQLYNKSKEAREVKVKPWILESWTRAGMFAGDLGNKEADVWRLEFRIQKKAKGLQLMETGDLFNIGLSDVMEADRVYSLFIEYANRYFRFVKRDYHVKRQQMQPLIFFRNDADLQPSIKLKIVPSESHSVRTATMLHNFLDEFEKRADNGQIVSKTYDVKTNILRVQRMIDDVFPRYIFNQRAPKKSSLFVRLDNLMLYGNILNSKRDLFPTILLS